MGYLSAKQINHLKDLQKSNYAGRRSFQGMSLRVVGLADAVIEFAELMEQCTLTERSRVIDSATPIALEIYKSIVPVSSKAHRISTSPFKNKKMQGWEENDRASMVVQPGNLRKSIIDLSKTQNNNNNNNKNGIIIIPEIIPQELPQHEDIMDKKARQKLKKAIRDKAYREKNKEIIKIKSALHYQEKKNK